MDLDSRKLDELLELTRDNNKILRGLRRVQRWSSFFTFVYWAVILGSILGTYYYLQPQIQKYINLFQTSAGTLQKIQQGVSNIPTDTQAIRNLVGK